MSFSKTNFQNKHISSLISEQNEIRFGFNSGGYEKFAYFITQDGGLLGIDTVLAEMEKTDFNNEYDPQFFIIGSAINYESHLVCDHSGEEIPAAYEDDF